MPNLLLVLALATGPEILVPPWPLSPDGDLVAVRGRAPLSAERGAVEAAGAGLYRVVPEPGVQDVALAAGSARATVRVEPPPGTIDLAVRPAAPVKGRDRRIEVEIAVSLPGGELDATAEPPEIVASSGRVRGVARTGPGRFRGVYEPAPTRHPEVVVLLATSPRCPLCPTPRAIGFAVVPLAAAIDLPGRAEPGARTTIRIAGRTFGPVAAGRKGSFSLPVEVPPGARTGTADTLDAIGNRRTNEVELNLPEVDTLACTAWPRALPADGRSAANVWCVASTPSGVPAPGAKLVLRASAGEVDAPAPFRGALQRARFRAPRGGGGREAILSAAHPGGGAASRDDIPVGLAAGVPAEISATLATEPVPLGASVSATTAVRDARGDVVGLPHGPPGARLGFVAPDRFVARAEADGLVQDASLELALAPGREAASLSLRRDRTGWVAEARTVDARPAAGVELRFGSGATAVTDERGAARVSGEGAREWVLAANGARAAGWKGIEPPAAPFEISRNVRVALRPPSDVDVVAWLDGAMLRWRVQDAQGHELAGRRVALRPSGVELGPAEADGGGGRAPVRGGRGTVAVVDLETGVAAVVEAR
jgi:hypothetical protein